MVQFTPKQYKKEQFTIRMEHEMLKNVDALAAENNFSRSEVILQCVQFPIEHRAKENQ